MHLLRTRTMHNDRDKHSECLSPLTSPTAWSRSVQERDGYFLSLMGPPECFLHPDKQNVMRPQSGDFIRQTQGEQGCPQRFR